MITDKDVKKLIGAMQGVFATKEDLRLMESRMERKFATKEDLLKLDIKYERRYDKLFTLLDGVAKRVKDIWEELALTQHRVERLEKFRERMSV